MPRKGPIEAVTNSIKQVKRTAFGFMPFRKRRIRSLFHAGMANLGPDGHRHSPLIPE